MTKDQVGVLYLVGMNAFVAATFLLLGYMRHADEPMTRRDVVVALIGFCILSGMIWSIPWFAALPRWKVQ